MLVYKSFEFPETLFNAKSIYGSHFMEKTSVKVRIEQDPDLKLNDIYIFPLKTSLMHCLVWKEESLFL